MVLLSSIFSCMLTTAALLAMATTAAPTAASAPDSKDGATVADVSPPTTSSLPWTLTGLLGTFTADLFRNETNSSSNDAMVEEGTSNDTEQQHVLISTAPSNFSEGMFSWFPLYFPLKDAVHVPAGASLRVYMWRRVDATSNRVWYEWSVTVHRDGNVLSVTPIHNPNGRSYHVSM